MSTEDKRSTPGSDPHGGKPAPLDPKPDGGKPTPLDPWPEGGKPIPGGGIDDWGPK